MGQFVKYSSKDLTWAITVAPHLLAERLFVSSPPKEREEPPVVPFEMKGHPRGFMYEEKPAEF